jgi:4-amino-4-deoxy-L-arabinose transferase-like glycosyltransferase
MQRLRIAFILAAVGVCLVSLAAHAPLIDPDEGLHAAIAQEMVIRHEYVTPTFLGEPFLDKPILFFWAEAASLGTFGMNETAVRLPPLLFGLLGACAVALLGGAMFDRRAGYAAGIAYATMALPVGVSEVAVHDVALVPFLVLACYGIWRLSKQGHLLAWSAVTGVSIGLSILTKGLVAAAFAGLFGAIVAACDRRTLPRLLLAGVISVAVAAIVAAPWYLAMERAHPGYLHYYFVERHVEGYFTATQQHAGRHWWYYIPIVAGGALPWLPFAFARTSAPTSPSSRRIAWMWLFAGLILLTVGESKLATYVLPAFPAVALVIGERVASGRGVRGIAWLAFVITCAVMPIIVAAAVAWRFAVNTVELEAGAALAAAAVIAIAWRARAATDDRKITAVAAMAFVSLTPVLLLALPQTARWMSAKDLAAILNRRASLPPHVLVLDERSGSVIFYLSPRLRAEAAQGRFENVTLADVLGRLTTASGDELLAVRADQLARVRKRFGAPLAPDAQSGVYSVFSLARLRR